MTNDKKVKTALITTIAILMFVLGYLYIAVILTPKDSKALGGGNFYRASAINTEAKNSLDVLIVGDSSAHHGLNPLQIYKDTGITCYNLGESKQDPRVVKSQLKKVFKKQKPKLVIVEMNFMFTNYKYYGSMDLTQASLLIAPIKYHVRWKELTPKDFVTIPTSKSDDFKGYMMEDIVADYSMPEGFMQNKDAEKQKINPKKEKAVKNIVKYCKKQGADVLFVNVPNARDWNNAKSNAVKDFADNLNQPYIDYNYYDIYNKVDYNKHFKDGGSHLNIYGANVVSQYMSKYLTQNYNFEDKRGKNKFVKWDKLVNKYNSILL